MLERPVGNCVETTYTRNSQGYGCLDIAGKTLKHHRYVYACHHKLSMDDIKGKVVMHKCDNPPCVNPDHLVLGTVAENNQDKLEKGRNVGFTSGNTVGRTKLTDDQVREIKRRGREAQKVLAAEFGISVAMVSQILSGRRWSTVT